MLVFSGTRGGTSASIPGGEGDCGLPDDRAGIARLWAIPCAAVAGLTFDDDRRVSGVSLYCDLSVSGWEEIGFEQDTGVASETQQGFNRYDQSVRVSISGQGGYNRNQVNALSTCSCWHLLALDQSGNYKYYGVHTYERGAITVWEHAGMSSAGNGTQSGVSAPDGGNQTLIGLAGRSVHQLAPHAIGPPEDLVIDCDTGRPASVVLGGGSFNPGGGDTSTGGDAGGGDTGGGTNPGEPGNENNWTGPDGAEWTGPDGSAWYKS